MLKIYALNVNLGDSLIVESNIDGKKYFSVIDCKKIGDYTPTVDFLSKYNITNISSLIITHFHNDHTSGLSDLYDYLYNSGGTLDYVIFPYLPTEAEMKLELISRLYGGLPKKDRLSQIRAFKKIQQLPSSLPHNPYPEVIRGTHDGIEWRSIYHPGLDMAFLHPNAQDAFSFLKGALKSETYKYDLNSISLVFMFKAEDIEREPFFCFFGGDLDKKYWRTVKNRYNQFLRKIQSSKNNLKYIKLPHHGGKNNCMLMALPDMLPSENKFFITISCPFNSRHHPHIETLTNIINNYSHAHLACTNVNSYCFENKFFSKSEEIFLTDESEAEFEEFAEDEDIIMSEECAGSHVFIASDSFYLHNSTNFYCKISPRI